jgi:WD40 repeat protein
MPALSRILLLAASLNLAAGWAAAEPAPGGKDKAPDKAEPVRTDATGDPLPPGVIARLGSSRLFQPRVDFLAFSPDGKTLAAVGMAGHLHLWEVNSGKELQHFQTPPGRGWTAWGPVAFSPDGKLVALGCADNQFRKSPDQGMTVRVWETATGKTRSRFEGVPGLMTQLQFHPGGRYLAAGGYGGSVQLLDLQENKVLAPRGDFKAIGFLAYSADGKSLVALASDEGDEHKKTFCRWDADGKELARRPFETDGPYHGALSPDGTLFASPTPDGETIRLLDPSTGKEHCRTEGKTSGPGFVSFATDGKTLTTSDNDGTVRVWGTGQGKLLHEFKGLSTRIDHIALSPGGKLVALNGRADGAIHVFETATGKELHTFVGHRGGPLTVAFAPDGKTVFTVSRDGSHSQPVSAWADWSLREWDPVTGKELRVTTANLGGEAHWTFFSADARFLATITHEGTLRLWDTRAGKELRRWGVPTRVSISNGVKSPAQHVEFPAFTPEGKSLIAASEAKCHRWDVNTGRAQPPIDLPEGMSPPHCVPGPDERAFIARQWNQSRSRAALLDATSGRVVRWLAEVNGPFPACAFSPDGYTFAVAAVSGPRGTTGVTLLEIASGRERIRLNDTDWTDWVRALAFSPDGKLLAVGGPDVVRLFHLVSGRAVGRLDAYRGEVDSLAFSPDGKWLAVGGHANTALVCDVAALTTGQMPEVGKLTAKELDALYDDLKSADGAKAYVAVTRLAASGKESTPFLKERLKGEPGPDEQRIARLIADLDDDSFDVRERASAALERLGTKAEAALRQALAETKSAEVRRRAELVLAKFKPPASPLPSEELVRLRMLEALARSGTPEAREFIKELAKGDPEARLTQEAKAALRRWDRRESAAP